MIRMHMYSTIKNNTITHEFNFYLELAKKKCFTTPNEWKPRRHFTEKSIHLSTHNHNSLNLQSSSHTIILDLES